MKYKIKRFNDTDAVVISDEEIKKNDFYISFETNYATHPKERWVLYNLSSATNGSNPQKVIATISPFKIEGLPILEIPNQEEDVKQLAEEWFLINNYNRDDLIHSHHIPNAITNKNLWIAGYKAAQKQFSEEDIRNAIKMAREVSGMEAVVKLIQNEHLNTEDFQYTEEEIIQSLQNKQFPTSIELTEDFKPLK